jgi:flagellar biosynthesis/type III secretory pathway protein FliH
MTHVIGQYLHVAPVAQKVERSITITVTDWDEIFTKSEQDQARIAKLEAERDAAYAEGYRAGVEDAANRITASIQMLRNLGMTENAEAFVAAAEDVRALLNSEAEP